MRNARGLAASPGSQSISSAPCRCQPRRDAGAQFSPCQPGVVSSSSSRQRAGRGIDGALASTRCRCPARRPRPSHLKHRSRKSPVHVAAIFKTALCPLLPQCIDVAAHYRSTGLSAAKCCSAGTADHERQPGLRRRRCRPDTSASFNSDTSCCAAIKRAMSRTFAVDSANFTADAGRNPSTRRLSFRGYTLRI